MRKKTLIRKNRNRSKLKKVNTGKPRLTVFRSLSNIYVQLIDDDKRTTIVSASSKEKGIEKKSKTEDRIGTCASSQQTILKMCHSPFITILVS